jgi:response regulator NasT
MPAGKPDAASGLRILIAGGRYKRFEHVTETVRSLGHEVVGHEMDLSSIGRATTALKPDVAVVIVGESTDEALRMIGRIVQEAACPVITVLAVEDRHFINEAAKRGIFAYIADGEDAAQFQSSIDIVLRRFAEFHNLEGAFGRRAVTERAKGILMERHSIDEQAAFALLRDHARSSNRKIVDVAEAILATFSLLPGRSGSRSEVDDSTRSDPSS